ncbi:MAG: serine/threonine protein kinase [Coleofasciculaceae cyanobacterium SM2_1_6]|nr:serine/threonine protein kinase [Coleofasciculaceae cyanobacterium SM2_1_6]
MEGKLLGDRYLLQEKLGDQIGRKTFLALDKLAPDITKNSVVVKLLSLGNNFSWQHLKLFTREAETLKKLNHPAIPRYLDYLEIDEADFKGFALVQTYIEAENLEYYLKAGRTFSEAEVIQIARALLDTLIYLQAQSPAIVHRDLKPSNILLTNRSGHQVGDVYLVDFGSVQHLAAQEGGTITVVGTYGYMPPEQFGGRTTPASDLYSLGATLIYLVTGRHPTELPQANFRLQFASLANLSPAFEDWLGWLTEPSLEQRLDTAAQALEALNTQEIRSSITQSSELAEPINNFALKPQYTDIVCRKSTECIEFTIPTPGLGFAILGLASFVTPIILTITSQGIGQGSITILIVLTLLFGAAVAAAIFNYFGKIKLRIDHHQITLKKELWGFKKNILPPSSTQAIQEIYKSSVPYGKNADGNFICLTNKLEIVAGCRRYPFTSFHTFHKLSTQELDWAGTEISEWLGMPIEEKSKSEVKSQKF